MARGAEPPEVHPVLRENIQKLVELRHAARERRTWQERVADTVASFAGRPAALLTHVVLFAGWLAVNSGLLPVCAPWDPFPFSLLSGIASVEAIFLTLFVLMSQGREAQLDEGRAELDLQMNLLAEHEVTRLIQLVDAIAVRLGVERPADVDALKEDVDPEHVVERIEEAIRPRP